MCFSCDLFRRYTHKMSFSNFFLSAFQFLLFDCWPFDFLRTRCNMHVSLRSNGQSPLWLPAPNHSSRPSSRISFVSLCVSLSLCVSPSPLSLLSLPHYVCTNLSFISWVFALIYMFLTCFVHLSLSIVKWLCVVVLLFECFSVCAGLSCILCWILYFVVVVIVGFFCFINVFDFCTAVFCCLMFWLPLCSSCVLLWVLPSPTICLLWIGMTKEIANKTVTLIHRKMAQISLVQDIFKDQKSLLLITNLNYENC